MERRGAEGWSGGREGGVEGGKGGGEEWRGGGEDRGVISVGFRTIFIVLK